MRKFLIIVVSLVFLGCSDPTEPGSDPKFRVELLKGFLSYQSPQEVMQLLPSSVKVAIVENQKYPGGGSCTKFDTYTIKIKSWLDRQVPGTLRMYFINDSLYQTTFHPNNISLYVERLNADGIQVSKKTPEVVETGVEVRLTLNHVSWTHKQISNEIGAWIMQCS